MATWWDALTNLVGGGGDAAGPQVARRTGKNGAPGNGGGFDIAKALSTRLNLERSRRAHYEDFEQMDREAPEAHRALEAFTDTAMSDGGSADRTIQMEFKVPGVEEVLRAADRNVKMDDRAWGHLFATRKLGEHFLELVFDKAGGLRRLKDLPVREIRRVEDEHGLPDPFPWRQHDRDGDGGEIARFREWQIVQIADLPAGSLYGYARSQLAAARRPWKAIELAQNAILAERIAHTGTRLAFNVNVSGLSTDEALEYMREVRRDYEITQSHSISTGKRSGQYAPLTNIDNIWMPWTKDGPAKPLEVIRFGAEIGEIADIKFLYGRFLSGLGVPRYELGLDEDIRSKAATGIIDAGFIRRVVRAQRVYLRARTAIYNRALYAAGFEEALTGDYRKLYRASFAPLQLMDEKLRWEIAKLRADVAKIYGVDLAVVSPEFVLRHFLDLDDEQVEAALDGLPEPEAADSKAAAAVAALPKDKRERLIRAAGGPEGAARLSAALSNLIDAIREPADTDAMERGTDASERPQLPV